MSQWEECRAVYLTIEGRFRLRRLLQEPSQPATWRQGWPLLTHLRLILAASGLEDRITCEGLLMGTAAASILCSISVFWISGLAAAVFTGAFVCAVPYLALRMQLNRRRVKASREGDVMVRELLCNYKIHGSNMKEAIEVTARTLENAPHAKRLLYDLANGFNRAYTRRAIEKELEQFRYSLGTAWGAALAQIIGFAEIEGWKVTNALEDLSRSLMRSRQIVEHSKRENHEAQLMLRYLVPVSYGLSVLCACRFFGFTLKRFLQYQFATEAGLRWFLIVAVLYTFGILLGELLGKEKMDL